jgi:hypothetical protein
MNIETELEIIRNQPKGIYLEKFPGIEIMPTHYSFTYLVLLNEGSFWWDGSTEMWRPLTQNSIANHLQYFRSMNDIARIVSDTNQAVHVPNKGWLPV